MILTMRALALSTFVSAVVLLCGSATAALRTAAVSGYWTNSATWGGTIPGDTDDAVIDNAVTVTLDTATADLNSLTNNGTLIFQGWSNTILTSTWVYVAGTITHTTNTDQTGAIGVYADWTPDSRVWIVCSNLTVVSGGKIDANGKGYVALPGGGGTGRAGIGPGGGGGATSDHGGGGGYGGVGGDGQNTKATGGISYGSFSQPTDPGSSGASTYNYVPAAKGGNGGGAILVAASGLVTIDGTLSANGDSATQGYTSGAGSGGSVFITCASFTGNGALRASGGKAVTWGTGREGAGGGGRIAVVYDPVAQSNATPPSVTFDLRGELGGPAPSVYAEPGSLYLTDTRFLDAQVLITNSFTLAFRDSTNWIGGALTVSNSWVKLPTNFPATFTNGLRLVGTYGRLDVLEPAVVTAPELLITNSARLYLYAGPTNTSWPSYGGLLTVNGLLAIGTNSTLFPYSHASNGGSMKLVAQSVSVASNGAIDAAGKGYRGFFPSPSLYVGYGPGGGGAGLLNGSDRGPGAGHGGRGGADSPGRAGGATYGSSNAPTSAGSAGYNGYGYDNTYGPGGGVIWVDVLSEIRVDGALSANGGSAVGYGGGGAGGSIYVTAETLSGTGQLLAKGGNGGPGSGSNGGGGGGGGRIALWTSFSSEWTGSYSVTNGTQGYTNQPYGSNGTYVVGYIIPNRPGISNSEPSNLAVGSATLNGFLFTTGRSDTAAMVYWGTQDLTTNVALWANTNDFPAPQVEGALATNVSFPAVETMLYYRYRATNNGGEFWAADTRRFLAGAVNFLTLNPAAYEQGLQPATVSVVRAETATNGPLTVLYTVGGTATGGTDYTALGGSVLIPDGQTNALIVIQPLYDGGVTEGDETITLSMVVSNYLAGPSNAVSIPLIDYTIPPGANTNIASGAWGDIGSWSIGRPPIAGDSVTIATNIVMDVAVGPLVSLTVQAGQTLTFSGSNTCVTAETVTVNGALTHATNTATASPWTPNGRVCVVCTNFTLAAGGRIDVDARGYVAPAASATGRGPGGGAASDHGGGGGYGGVGNPAGNGTAGGVTYGSAAAPTWPGSSGGSGFPAGTSYAGDGGGLVMVQAAGGIVIDGIVTANGESISPPSSQTGGGGAGGSVYLSSRTFEGAGQISAAGGHAGTSSLGGGGGAGGRIAIIYDTTAQGGVTPPTVSFAANGGRNGYSTQRIAMPGSLYLSDDSFYNPNVFTSGVHLIVSNRTSWAPASLQVQDAWLRVPGGIGVGVTGDIVVTGQNAVLEFLAPASVAAANMTLTNGAQAWFYSGPTNGVAPDWGSLVSVPGTLRLSTNCAVYPVCDPTNGGAVRFEVGTLAIDAGATFSADSAGFQGYVGPNDGTGRYGRGPGGGMATDLGAGGGYGGVGGGANRAGSVGGPTYGSSNAPTWAGSAGGKASANPIGGGAGGGVVWVQANRVTVNGIVSANGGTLQGNSGGGSGGSIYITTARFGGDGLLRANGGPGPGVNWAGGGGGGRIAVWRIGVEVCSATATGGAGYSASSPGTIVWGALAPPGSLFVVH